MVRKNLGRAATIVAAIVALGCAEASAQPGRGGPGYGWGPGMMMGPGMMGGAGFGFMCNPRAAGFAEWRMERIEAAVRPTDAQRKALNDLQTASNKAAELIASTCPSGIPAKSIERLTLAKKRLETMLQAIDTVQPSFEAFYAMLDDQQKTRLDSIGPQRWGWRRWRWHWGE